MPSTGIFIYTLILIVLIGVIFGGGVLLAKFEEKRYKAKLDLTAALLKPYSQPSPPLVDHVTREEFQTLFDAVKELSIEISDLRAERDDN